MNTPGFQQVLQAAMQHHQAGRLGQAEVLYRHVLQDAPDQPDALNLLGLIAHQSGKHEMAIGLIVRAIRINGSDPGCYCHLGLAYQALKRFEEAIACFQQALVLAPDFSIAHCNLGLVLQHQGKQDDAVLCYQRALAITPNLAEAYCNLGNVYSDQGKLDFAQVCLQRAIAIKPGLSEVHSNLGNVFLKQGKPDDAVNFIQRALKINPDYAGAYNTLGTVYLHRGLPESAVACFDKALAIRPDNKEAYSAKLFALLYLSDFSPADMLTAHRQYAEQFESPIQPYWKPHDHVRVPQRRLKVGYVSADFYRHSVTRFIEPIFAHHDKSKVEVYCYYNYPHYDAVTERLKSYADHWVPCKVLTDEQLAERIRADGVDVLVDLSGHTWNNRLLTFAHKPAPVQVTYLGYAATSGLSAMDYRFTTEDVDPPGNENFHSETLFRLPRSLWCYRHPVEQAYVPHATPAVQNGYVTFGSMNSFSKISPGALDRWADILQAVSDSRLIMTCVPEGSARAQLLVRFAKRGIEIRRITLHGTLPADQFLTVCRQIDITLDSFPYNGTTTTCESLWMGIPVVSLAGRSSVSRSGYALLKGLGLEGLVAQDEGEYVSIAAALARDLSRLTELHATLRGRFAASALRDEVGFTRDLEAAYRAMWREWCRRAGGRE